jgi:hypothetical protein
MALKLLNPGLRPLGQFDLHSTDVGKIVGGEYVEMQSVAASEIAAADVYQYEDPSTPGNIVNFTRKERQIPNIGGLADEGGKEYGTLYGDLVGSTAGRQTQFGASGGAVILGPTTDRASGKVTVWAQAGLYGISGAGATYITSAATNAPLFARLTSVPNPGRLDPTLPAPGDGSWVASMVGAMDDSSLVSTTRRAAGATPDVEYYAVFYVGTGGYDA